VTFFLAALLGCRLLADAEPARPVLLRYVRPQDGRWVLESEVTRQRAAEGTTYVSRTERPGETMTLTFHLDRAGRVTAAEAVLETASGKKQATATVRGGNAVVRRAGTSDTLPLPGDPVVTTAPDWSDIFELVRRYDDKKAGRQEFAGLWFHPTRPARVLGFTVERIGKDTVRKGDRDVTLGRYRIHLRSGDYLAWADADHCVYKLLPLGPRAKPVVREGYEDATRQLGP
jgi:hypothetical protein